MNVSMVGDREVYFDWNKQQWIFSDTGEVYCEVFCPNCKKCITDNVVCGQCEGCHDVCDIKLKSGCIKRIDRCISSIVKELNDIGIPTVHSSCCGHGKEDGYILIPKKYFKEIKQFDDCYLLRIPKVIK